MILKRIELKGFKSFADRTIIDFNDAITCIVGPNGSGKSNITDAFRWVLGEQRYKTLRGSQMLDVIFNGTSARQALGFAEVNIIFDNQNKDLAIDFEEVKVTRRLYRSGESEYTINGAECRLKDIKQLFMDTGIGVEGYSIIGQGRIDSILSTNKDERRLIFEEAAGIVKYRTRKSDAERKLNRTEQNLSRIRDIISELNERLAPLEKSARKAHIYKELSAELKDLEINLFIDDIEKANKNINILTAQLNDYQSSKNKIENELNHKLSQLNRHNNQSENLEKIYDDDLLKHGDLLKNLTSDEGKLNLIKEKISANSNNLKNMEISLELEQKDLANLAEVLSDLKAEINSKQEQKAELDAAISASNAELSTYKNNNNDLLKTSQNKKAALVKLENELNSLKSNKERLSLKADMSADKLKQVETEIAETQKKQEAQKQDLTVVEKEQVQVENDLKAIVEKQAKQLETETVLKAEIDELAETILQKRTKLSEQEANLDALIMQEQNNEGFSYAVKQVLTWSADDDDVYGSFKDLLKIDAKFFTAIEIALGRNLQMIVLKDSTAVDKYIDLLKKHRAGRATFLPLKQLKAKPIPELETSDGFYGCAIHYTDYPAELEMAFRYLLSGIYFADSLQDAKRAAATLPTGSRVVSLDGQIVNAGGTLTGGSIPKKETGFLKRKQQITDLQESNQALSLEIKDLSSTREQKQVDLSQLTADFSAINKELTETKDKHNKLLHRLENLQSIINNFNTSIYNLKREQELLMAAKESGQTEIEQLLTEIDDLNKAITNSNEEIIAIEQEISSNNQQLQSLNDALTEKRIELSRINENMHLQKQKRMDITARIDNYNLKRDKAATVKADLEQTITQLEQEQIEIDSKIAKDKVAITELEQSLAEQKEAIASAKLQQGEFSTVIADLRSQVQAEQQSAYKLEIDLARLETKRTSLTDSLLENYQLTYQSALQFKTEFEHKDYQSRLRKLKREIKALGEINLASIEEYKTVKERYDFLTEQEDDLNQSVESMNKMIRQIDREMRKAFKTKLSEVNNYFGDTFSKLFGGGTGKIEVAPDVDILDAEIIISAQPPGKKLQSLDLLSGGEKALTAIALLFAILKTKPSPFCILDEIEAALDDANIFRFADFLQEFIQNSQFIIITHRKGTMEIAESIYGVTMQEKGISKVLSVKLQEAGELVEV